MVIRPHRLSRASARSAFTLLEVSLVAVLLVVLAAMAWPSIEAIYGGVRQNAAADLIRGRWADARSHAIDESRPYRFAIVPDTGRFRVAPDTADNWESGGVPADDFEDADTHPLIVEDELPSGVKFAEMLVDLRKTKGLLQSKIASFQASPNTDKVIAEFF